MCTVQKKSGLMKTPVSMVLKAAVSHAVGAGCNGTCRGQNEPSTYLVLTFRCL